jgi:thiamine-phosphate pyrophosphorylase
MAITDLAVCPLDELETRLAWLLASAEPGSVAVQLRDPELSAADRLALGHRLRRLTRDHEKYLMVNDRLDIAVLVRADGVHLGERSVRPEDARAALLPSAWISRACHDPAEAAPRDADAVVLSPIVAPRKGRPALGLSALTTARRHAGGAALYALGGVDAHSAAQCLAAGAHGVAAIGSALGLVDPGPLLQALGIARCKR